MPDGAPYCESSPRRLVASSVKPAFSIRDADGGDAARVAEIKVRNWTETYGPLVPPDILRPHLDPALQASKLRNEIASPGVLLLVGNAESGPVAGFALTRTVGLVEPWLESLHVISDWRGHGLGALLMRSTAQRLVGLGYRSMSLGVVVGNDLAAGFYDRLGAAAVGMEATGWAPGVFHTVYRWADLHRLAGRES